MAHKLPSFLSRIAVLVLVALGATTGLTFAAGGQVGSAPAVSTVDTAPAAPLVVPDVRNQAFVFAKGTLGDARTQSLWGIGAKSAATAQQALDEVKAKAKS